MADTCDYRQEKGISNDIYLYSFLDLLFITLIIPHVGVEPVGFCIVTSTGTH